MPVFDFKCRNCGRVSEIIIRRANEEVTCPGCGKKEMEKMITSSYTVIQSGGLSRSLSKSGTCCGRSEKCQKPPCSSEGKCRR